MPLGEVYAGLGTTAAGLSEEEAKKRLLNAGPNIIQEHQRLPRLKILLNQFRNPLILILILAGLLTIVLREWVEAVVIFAAVAVNALLGFWQENKAESVLELLKTYVRIRARVRRGGEEREMDAAELVAGDVVRITQGDRVPADGRLVWANNLEIDESILTGESLPTGKNSESAGRDLVVADRRSMAHGGTLVTGGFGDMVITATGSNTEFGKIATLVSVSAAESTPLQRSINHFASRAGMVLAVFVTILFLLGVGLGYELFDMFLIAVSVAVSAVPEGLPVALSVILAIGVQRLAKRRAIVRQLLAAETLGSTTLILTDKTGTLTQAKMELITILPYSGNDADARRKLLGDAILNTDVVIENPEDSPEKWRMAGRGLEQALVMGAAREGIFYSRLKRAHHILDRLPFQSQQKFSAVLAHSGRPKLILLGAPEILLGYCDLSREEQRQWIGEADRLAFAGERVLAVATREFREKTEQIVPSEHFRKMKFQGLLGLQDPLRPDTRDAIRRISAAGVRTVIVTGDHRGTAEAVARELGMLDGQGRVMTGEELEKTPYDLWRESAREITVYARVSPEQKVKIVEMYQKLGEVVAVTGDGVNDAPALERADIGVAVGAGTDVAKSASDLIILDNDFESIGAAIEEGRHILGNIRKVIVYLLSSVADELFLIGGALLTGLVLPISALQILFVNFFSDSFPAIALAFERGGNSLEGAPPGRRRSLFDPQMKFLILAIGLMTSFFLFLLYWFLLRLDFSALHVRTFIFASFSTYTLFLAFSMRDLEKSIFQYHPFTNLYLSGGVALGLLFTMLVIYLPVLQAVFGTVSLSFFWIAGVLGVGIFNILAVEFGKKILRGKII